jgi:hypothetical protein
MIRHFNELFFYEYVLELIHLKKLQEIHSQLMMVVIIGIWALLELTRPKLKQMGYFSKTSLF